MNLFSSSSRYAWVLALALGALYVLALPARAEMCGGASVRETGELALGPSLGPPVTVGTIRNRVLTLGGTSVVRFGVARYFSSPNNNALTYAAHSSRPNVATAEICGSILKIVAERNGSTKVTVTASDGANVAEQSFMVRVGNRGPVAVGEIADTTFTKKAGSISLVLSSSFRDPDGDSLTYVPLLSRAGVVSARVKGSTLTLTAESKGTSRVTVRATDPGNLYATQPFDVTIANSPPDTLGKIADKTFTQSDATLNVDVSIHFHDADRDKLFYKASSSNTGVVTASIPPNGSSLTLSALKAGTAKIEVTASDGTDSSIPHPFTVDVEAGTSPPSTNNPPEIEKDILDREFTVGDKAVSLNLNEYFSDMDPGDVLGYTAKSSNSDVAIVNPKGSPLRITPKKAGKAIVMVTATDLGHLSAEQEFEVEVNERVVVPPPPENNPPEIEQNIPAQKFTVGDKAVSFNLNEYFRDPDPGDVLTYTPASSKTGVATASVRDSILIITPQGVGMSTVKVTATDTGNLVVAQDVSVTVAPRLPLTVAIKGPSSIESGTSHTWRSKVEGGTPPYRYSWQVSTRCTILDHLSAAPDDEPCTRRWSSAGSDSSLTQTITTTDAYAHVRLSVSDAGSPVDTAEDTHSVEVYQPNNAPVANGTVPSRTLTLGSSPTQLNVSSWFTDKDNDPLRYTVASSPAGIVSASIPSNGGTLTLSTLKAGKTTVTVTASDGKASATQSFEVRVNRRPVASKAIPAQSVTVGGSSVTINLTEYFSDLDGDNLTWTITRSNSHVTTSLSGNTLTIAPVTAGTSSVGIHASDSYASVSQMVTVNVATAAGLSASISGPTRVFSEVSNTWQASVSGGRSPYAYRWRYRRACSGPSENAEADSAREVCTEWASGGSRSSFSLMLEHGTTIELRVTDANNDSVTTTLGVSYAGL